MKCMNYKRILYCSMLLFNGIMVIALGEHEPKTMQFILIKKAMNKNIIPYNRDFFVEMKRLFNPDVFVETGTYLGDTSEIAATVFDKVRTVELSEELCVLARRRFAQNPQVSIYQGDSGVVLNQVLSTIPSGSRAIILLDSHWSGGNTAHGFDVPILRELDAIKKSGIKKSIILIDDLRCFQNQPPESPDSYQYPDLPLIIKCIHEIDPQYTCLIYGDVLLAYNDPHIKVPAIIQAMTTSRLNQESDDALCKAEAIIAAASDEDFYHISQLATLLDVSTGNWRTHYYDFWYALALNKRGNTIAAYQYMQQAARLGFKRAQKYLELWK